MRCFYCKGKIAFDAQECPHCLKSFDIEYPKTCPVCGGYWREGDFECRWCYTRLRWVMQEDLMKENLAQEPGAAVRLNNEIKLLGAGLKRRMMATLLDGMAAMFFLTLINPQALVDLVSLNLAWAAYWAAYGEAMILTLGLWLLYFIVFEGVLGWTPGKILSGLRVIQTDGSRIDLIRAAVRNLYRIIDGLFFYLIGALIIWRTPLHQRLGDLAAGTLVVEKKCLEEEA